MEGGNSTTGQSSAGVVQKISMRNTRKLGEAFHRATGKVNCQEWKYTLRLYWQGGKEMQQDAWRYIAQGGS